MSSQHLIHNGRLEEPDRLSKNASPQSDAQNKFQVMLHDLIMRHKASLQMFDDICHLVNEYTSSQEFSIHTKLQSWKSFLRYMEGSHQTHLLRPTNRNVTLHDDKTVTVPVFDMKEMLISILTDTTLCQIPTSQRVTMYSLDMSITTILAIKSTVKYTLVMPGYLLGIDFAQIPTVLPCLLV